LAFWITLSQCSHLTRGAKGTLATKAAGLPDRGADRQETNENVSSSFLLTLGKMERGGEKKKFFFFLLAVKKFFVLPRRCRQVRRKSFRPTAFRAADRRLNFFRHSRQTWLPEKSEVTDRASLLAVKINTGDRFYETPFRPKTSCVNVLPQIFHKFTFI
jgi:hypothetical protein